MEPFLDMLLEKLQSISESTLTDEGIKHVCTIDAVKETIDGIRNEFSSVTLCYLAGPCEYQTEEANINHGWTPCKKELPKEVMQDCLVTLRNGAVSQAMYSQVTNEFKMVCLHDVAPFPKDNPVIAWRPMPSGYEPADEDEL